MSPVVRNVGDLKNARNLGGEIVYRKKELYLSSYHSYIPCLNTDTHFIYKSNRLGASTLCTCGSPATIVGYHAYARYNSYIGNEVLACHTFIQFGVHNDRSH